MVLTTGYLKKYPQLSVGVNEVCARVTVRRVAHLSSGNKAAESSEESFGGAERLEN